ncbi:MAG: phosphotransferase [Desulfobulbaceae bacterium]|nr:phosphotransferase [Desulfobulbaceae bacterium]
MNRTYLGQLPQHDPLHKYLRDAIQPLVNGSAGTADYRVFRLNGSNDVYLYEDLCTGAKVVGKFFHSPGKRNEQKAVANLAREFDNLVIMREYGLKGYPHLVVRPLGSNSSLNALLVTEYCDGVLFSELIVSVIGNGGPDRLYSKLTALAYFLSAFHSRASFDAGIDFNQECAYADHVVNRLLKINALDGGEAAELSRLRDQWQNQPRMWEDRQVLVHGDATPENFIFGQGLNVIALDLERTKRADRVSDTGRIAAELKHFFMRATGDRYAAEPFIGHFLWEYACHFPDPESTFRTISGRTPFYMGITLLRIARNSWITPDYRRRLINEAKECLRRFRC